MGKNDTRVRFLSFLANLIKDDTSVATNILDIMRHGGGDMNINDGFVNYENSDIPVASLVYGTFGNIYPDEQGYRKIVEFNAFLYVMHHKDWKVFMINMANLIASDNDKAFKCIESGFAKKENEEKYKYFKKMKII